MAGHTPGKWTVFDERTIGRRVFMPDDTIEIRDSHRAMIACLYKDNIANGGDAANARLIAAAPMLLEACKEAQHVWWQGCVDRGYRDERNWIDEAKDKIDAAIALATPAASKEIET